MGNPWQRPNALMDLSSTSTITYFYVYMFSLFCSLNLLYHIALCCIFLYVSVNCLCYLWFALLNRLVPYFPLCSVYCDVLFVENKEFLIPDSKPLSKPLLGYCQLDHKEQTSVTFWSKHNNFHSRKCLWKYRLRNGGHFPKRMMS